jgi:hypothetical protein
MLSALKTVKKDAKQAEKPKSKKSDETKSAPA